MHAVAHLITTNKKSGLLNKLKHWCIASNNNMYEILELKMRHCSPNHCPGIKYYISPSPHDHILNSLLVKKQNEDNLPINCLSQKKKRTTDGNQITNKWSFDRAELNGNNPNNYHWVWLLAFISFTCQFWHFLDMRPSHVDKGKSNLYKPFCWYANQANLDDNSFPSSAHSASQYKPQHCCSWVGGKQYH